MCVREDDRGGKRERDARDEYISLPVEADKYKQNLCLLGFIRLLLNI